MTSIRRALSKAGHGTAEHFLVPVRTLRHYQFKNLPHDLMAGATVSVVDLPQSMAFALIAGVSPIYGIYTAIIQAALGGLFTSSAFLSNGPTNTQSLLVAAIVTRLADRGSAHYLTLVIALTLIKGIIQLAFAAARMGNLVRYVSNSVMIGFTAGAGVLIIAEQLPNFLGVHVNHGGDHLPGLIGAAQRLWPELGHVNLHAMGLGLGCLVLLLMLRRLSRFIPEALIAVAGAAAIVWIGGWFQPDTGVMVVGQVGEFHTGFASLPRFVLPHINMSMVQQLIGGAVALALLGMLESVAIAKSIGLRTGERIDANQEFFGQGVSNLVASFFQCMPGSGSFSRSALQYDAGARTRVCSLVTAGCNAAIIVALASAAWYIPLASLAAILFVVGSTLIDWKNIQRIFRTSPSDAGVCVITFASALLVPLTYAIYIGIFLNIALYLRRAAQLHVAEMVRTPGGPFIERPIRDRRGEKKVMFIQLEGDLFFGLADELQDRLAAVANSGVRVVILRLKRTHSVDITVLGALKQFVEQMQSHDGHVILCGLRPELHERLENFGLIHQIGEENIFQTRYGVFASAKAAIQRACALLGSSIDVDRDLLADDEPEGWAYQI